MKDVNIDLPETGASAILQCCLGRMSRQRKQTTDVEDAYQPKQQKERYGHTRLRSWLPSVGSLLNMGLPLPQGTGSTVNPLNQHLQHRRSGQNPSQALATNSVFSPTVTAPETSKKQVCPHQRGCDCLTKRENNLDKHISTGMKVQVAHCSAGTTTGWGHIKVETLHGFWAEQVERQRPSPGPDPATLNLKAWCILDRM
jgi:hypothetical protein